MTGKFGAYASGLAIGVLLSYAMAQWQADNAVDDAIAKLNKTRLPGCEIQQRIILNTARAFTADVRYIEGVILAGSVENDVRRNAQRKLQFVSESANQLRSMIYQCAPLIEKGERKIDEPALREAQGDL